MNPTVTALDDGHPSFDRPTVVATASTPEGDGEPIYYRTDGPYRGSAPHFYDVDQFPWARRLRDRWQAIRDEYEGNVRRGQDGVVDVFNPAGPKVPGWRSVNFQTYRWRYSRACRAFPMTLGLLDSIPGLVSAYMNVLEPMSSIPAHQGDSNAIVRFHLGLDVPSGDCAVRVGPETRRCHNGGLLAFCDAHEHASWNATTEPRVVLVFDVMLPAYQRRMRWICANVLSATGVIWLETKARVLRRAEPLTRPTSTTLPFPGAIRTALRRAAGLAIYLWLPIQRRRARSLRG